MHNGLLSNKDLTWKQKLRALIHFRKPRKHVAEHKQTAFFGLLDHDTFETIKSFAFFQLEMFRVVMACLLALFVPQACGDHACEIDETLHNLSGYATAVVVINFFTLGFAVLHYIIVFRRERFLIEYLDEDDSVGEEGLPKIVSHYPEIDNTLYSINAILLASSIVTSIMFIVNVIMSAILVFENRMQGYQSATVFATNVGLISTVLQKTINHAWTGLQYRVALSCLEFEPVSYNVIDSDYTDPHDESRGGRVEVDPKVLQGRMFSSDSVSNQPQPHPDAGYQADPPITDMGGLA